MSPANPIGNKKGCRREALELSVAIQRILGLPNDEYQDLLNKFEDADTPVKKLEIKLKLSEMGIPNQIINKFMAGAFSNNTDLSHWIPNLH
jgi:hypothetical protein